MALSTQALGAKQQCPVVARQPLRPPEPWCVDEVVLDVPLCKTVLNVTLTASQGKYSFDPVSKNLIWEVGRIEPGRLPNLRGSMALQAGAPPPDANPTITVRPTS
ncbi:hypothetical protein HPB49_003194 [Dermacentor silvarum]|uniref:Uncharacterized protein n=1 Tax=Dermacentor silvarum TaxID=543639 RepID=A0ACB8DUB0_DERSI|nr:hypothetical protein HPB49_003194 [Dermacentor silvarum]